MDAQQSISSNSTAEKQYIIAFTLVTVTFIWFLQEVSFEALLAFLVEIVVILGYFAQTKKLHTVCVVVFMLFALSATFILTRQNLLPNKIDLYHDAVVMDDGLYIREGPGEDYPWLGRFAKGTPLKVNGKDQSEDWLQVESPDQRSGWVPKQSLQFNINLFMVSVVPRPPLIRRCH